MTTLLTMKGFNRQWWTPGPNTIAYCPLEQNGVDITWNYELSIDVSSDISFSDNGYWLNVLNKSGVSNYERASCSERAWTIWIWAKLSDTPVGDDNWTIISQWQHYGIIYDNGRWRGTGVAIRLEGWNSTVAWSSHYNTNLTDWHLYMFTYDWTDTKFYVDGQLFSTINNFTPIQITELNLLWINSSFFKRWVRWQFSKALWEKPARTAQEIADYYNQTKSLYWIN